MSDRIAEWLSMLLAAIVILTLPLAVAVLRGWRWDWQCSWVLGLTVLGVPLAAVTQMPGCVLLIGIVALLQERQRRGRPVPRLWRLTLLRAFIAAAAFAALALADYHLLLRLRVDIYEDCLMDPDLRVVWPGLILATALVAGRLLHASRGEWLPPARAVRRAGRLQHTGRLLGAAALFGVLVVGLIHPWLQVHAVDPLLLEPARIQGCFGVLHVRPSDDQAWLTSLLLQARRLAGEGLDLLTVTALLFWVFQHVWARLWRPRARVRRVLRIGLIRR